MANEDKVIMSISYVYLVIGLLLLLGSFYIAYMLYSSVNVLYNSSTSQSQSAQPSSILSFLASLPLSTLIYTIAEVIIIAVMLAISGRVVALGVKIYGAKAEAYTDVDTAKKGKPTVAKQ